MIGHLVRACERGRRDASVGVKNHWRQMQSPVRSFYADGWRRERNRMERLGELPQLELGLQFDGECAAKNP